MSDARMVQVTGRLLVAGLLVFMVGAGFWRLGFQAPTLTETLRNVAEHRRTWLWIHVWIAAGTLLTVLGLTGWGEIQRQAGDRLATLVGLNLFLVGAVLWIAAVALRVTVQDWAAAETLREGMPHFYPPFHRLAGVLYAAHMILSYVAVCALGLGVISSRILSPAVGWSGVLGGGIAALGFVGLGGGPFAPPFLAHVYTFVLGVALLRRG